MKAINKLFYTAIVLLLVLVPNACTDHFDELNTNPKLVTDEIIKPELLFTKVLKQSSFEIQNQGRVGGCWLVGWLVELDSW